MPDELSFAPMKPTTKPVFGDRTHASVNIGFKKSAQVSERPSIASTQRASILSRCSLSSLQSKAKENDRPADDIASLSSSKYKLTTEQIVLNEIAKKRELKRLMKLKRHKYYQKVTDGMAAKNPTYIAAPATEAVPFRL
jgi:hypothetical protein